MVSIEKRLRVRRVSVTYSNPTPFFEFELAVDGLASSVGVDARELHKYGIAPSDVFSKRTLDLRLEGAKGEPGNSDALFKGAERRELAVGGSKTSSYTAHFSGTNFSGDVRYDLHLPVSEDEYKELGKLPEDALLKVRLSLA